MHAGGTLTTMPAQESSTISTSFESPVLGYQHVNLLVTDLDDARHFYGTGLGLEELPRPAVGGPGIWYGVGALQLHLSLVAEMPAGIREAFAHVALTLRSDTFAECVAAMEARGVVMSRQPMSREQDGATVQTAFCRDPFGNLFELTDVNG